MKELHFLHIEGRSIEEHLDHELKLLKESPHNWCLILEGTSPAIVMGISGKPELLINTEKLSTNPLPVIKRFSGGGTVVVDENTLFVTFIFQKDAHPFPAYPEPIMRWTEEIYKDVFPTKNFALRENDYVLGMHKCGGNAQYIKKDRWLHHTSFLWSFEKERMEYLLHPPKTPAYREGRDHASFLCTLKEHFSNKQAFTKALTSSLSKRFSLIQNWRY